MTFFSDFHFVFIVLQAVGSDALQLSSADRAYKAGHLYVGVHSFLGPCKFSLSLGKHDALAKICEVQERNEHQNTAAPSTVSSSNAELAVCFNCQKAIPPASKRIHEVQCHRLNYRCGACGEVMPVAFKNKHNHIKHTPVGCLRIFKRSPKSIRVLSYCNSQLSCRCGLHLEANALFVHRKTDCPLRLLNCYYCPLSIPARERGSHAGECGLLRSMCKVCLLPMQVSSCMCVLE